VSKRINVNPDHYKVAGRERQGEDIVHGRHKRELALEEKLRTRQRARAAGARAKSRKA
jgi:hypothetical protein